MSKQVTPTLSAEIRELLMEWVDQHPRFGVIERALTVNKISHAFAFIGSDGNVYASYDGQSKQTLHAKHADPDFLSKVEVIIEEHIQGCVNCQALLLPVSNNS